MNLPQNLFDGNVSVQTFLCQPDKEIIGEILPYGFNANFKFNTYSEISFTIDRYYNDLFDGTIRLNPYYDLVESLRVIYVRGVGHFIIQEIGEDVSENESKSITCFSLEYATGSKYLENFYVNTGEEGSVETMYYAQQYGAEYSIDNYYQVASKYNPYRRYYIKKYTDNNAYNYVEVPVLDENDFNSYDGSTVAKTLYDVAYKNVQFYDPYLPELSLLHLVFDRIPEWKIGHVDKELWHQERTFSEDRTAVYDFLYNTAAETLDFVMVWDSINGVVDFYKTTEDGITADEEVETQWNTDVFISRENLASALDIKYSTDDIKTKLKIAGSDGLDVRDVNLGQNHILNLSYYNTPLWLGEDLHLKYNAYTNDLVEYTAQYKEFISAWSAVYNEYSDLMNYVPAEPRVMLVGDKFEKLYCVKNQYLPASKEYNNKLTYYKYNLETLTYVQASPQPTSDKDLKDGQYYVQSNNTLDELVKQLQTKLERYKVDQQDNGEPSQIARTEDVLLTLENDVSDSATIRVRYDDNGENYRVYRTRTDASTGVSNTISFSLAEWVSGVLKADYTSNDDRNMNLSGFKIKSIGTLGAYFCLVRDEMEKVNLEDYGIKLLQEKQNTYTKIFITQTEGYMNEEGSQCVTSNEEPTGDEYPMGTKWLDTNNTKPDGSLIMKIRTSSGWDDYTPDGNDYENYARFYENYIKLGNVQTVLAEKQLRADYLLNGVAIKDRYITKENINSANLLTVTQSYFPEETITLVEYNTEFGFISFTIDSDTENKYATYVINGTPYVSYAHSQGLCLSKMNVLKEASDMNNYFTEQELVRLSPFIREDEYTDNNFLLTGYESEEEQMNIKQELLNTGDKELSKICQPKLSFSATMANILDIPEFAPLRNQFKLGNFIRVGIRENYTKRARLLEVQMSLDDPSDFSATFGDLISTRSEIDKHAELLQQAVTAGKSVAANQSSWQRAVDKSTELDRRINDGLQDATLEVGRANNQSIQIGQNGIWGRKLIDGTTDQYEPEQFRLINNKLVFSSDGFKTSKAVFGKYTINGEDRWGPLAEYITADMIEGKSIKGGSIQIGDENKPGGSLFIVNPDGSVEIKSNGQDKYASVNALEDIKNAYQYRIELSYEGNTIFNTVGQTCKVICKVYKETTDITNIIGSFNWYLNGTLYKTTTEPNITITNDNFTGSTQLNCQVTFDE